jgi:hypothetical protein
MKQILKPSDRYSPPAGTSGEFTSSKVYCAKSVMSAPEDARQDKVIDVAHPQDLGWNWLSPSFICASLGTLAASVLIVTVVRNVTPHVVMMMEAVEVAATAIVTPSPHPQPTESEEVFLDRLMMAESGGQDDAKNPRSSARGPFQFLSSTFLDLMSRYFPALVNGKSDAEVLQLRTDQTIARDAALVYTRENAAFLADRGLETNAAHLRLAFLVGASGAQRVIAAPGETPVGQLLSGAALEANPFMRGMTAAELIQRAALEASGVQTVTIPDNFRRPKFVGLRVRCTLTRPSCRKWVALAMRRKGKSAPRAASSEAKPAEAEKAKE